MTRFICGAWYGLYHSRRANQRRFFFNGRYYAVTIIGVIRHG